MTERCASCERRRFGGTVEESGAEFQRRYARPGVRSTCFTIGDMECDEVTAAIETLQRAGLWARSTRPDRRTAWRGAL